MSSDSSPTFRLKSAAPPGFNEALVELVPVEILVGGASVVKLVVKALGRIQVVVLELGSTEPRIRR
jgi:hypothetical protein